MLIFPSLLKHNFAGMSWLIFFFWHLEIVIHYLLASIVSDQVSALDLTAVLCAHVNAHLSGSACTFPFLLVKSPKGSQT